MPFSRAVGAGFNVSTSGVLNVVLDLNDVVLVAIIVQGYGFDAILGVADLLGNVYTRALTNTFPNSNTGAIHLFTATVDHPGTTSLTVRLNVSATNFAVIAATYSGQALGQSFGNAGAGTTPVDCNQYNLSTGPTPGTHSMIGIGAVVGSAVFTQNDGYILRQTAATNSGTNDMSLAIVEGSGPATSIVRPLIDYSPPSIMGWQSIATELLPVVVVAVPVVPITGKTAIKALQYSEERAFGVLSNSTPLWVGYSADWSSSVDLNMRKLPGQNDEDLAFLKPGRILNRLRVRYIPQDTRFLKYAVNRQKGGSGTIDKSLSLVYSLPLGGTGETYYQILGAKPDTVSITGRLGRHVMVDMELLHRSRPTPSTTSPITVPFATDPGLTGSYPFLFKNSTVEINGIMIDTDSITVNMNRNLRPKFGQNDKLLQYLVPGRRDITGNIVLLSESAAQQVQMINNTVLTLVWHLQTGGPDLTLTGVQLERLEDNRVNQDTFRETYRCTALGGAVA